MKARNLLILAVVTVALAIAAWYLREQRESVSVDNAEVYPGMLETVNNVAKIETVHGGKSMTLELQDGKWRWRERNGFPASANQVRKFLRGFAEMRRLEEKTSDPAKYAKLNVDDPSKPGSEAFGVTLKDAGGAVLADVVMGKDRSATADADMREVYLRKKDDAQSWLVQSDIRVLRRPVEWMERIIVAMHRDRIESVFIDHAGDENDVQIKRESPTEKDYELADVPDGSQIAYNFRLKDIAGAFTSLDFDDVMIDSGDLDFDADDNVRITLDTFDGMRVLVKVAQHNNERWAKLEAGESGRHSLVGQEGTEQLLDADGVKTEIERSNKHWAGWIFKVRGFKMDTITSTRPKLIEPATQ